MNYIRHFSLFKVWNELRKISFKSILIVKSIFNSLTMNKAMINPLSVRFSARHWKRVTLPVYLVPLLCRGMTLKGCEINCKWVVRFFRLAIKTNIKPPLYRYWPVDSLTENQNVVTYHGPIVMPTVVWCETIYRVSIMKSAKGMVSRKYVCQRILMASSY